MPLWPRSHISSTIRHLKIYRFGIAPITFTTHLNHYMKKELLFKKMKNEKGRFGKCSSDVNHNPQRSHFLSFLSKLSQLLQFEPRQYTHPSIFLMYLFSYQVFNLFFWFQFSFLFSFLSYPSLLTLYTPFFSAAIFFFPCPSLQSPLAFFVSFLPFTFLSNPNCSSLWPCFILSFSSCLSTLSPINLPRTFSNQTASLVIVQSGSFWMFKLKKRLSS